MSRYKFDTAEAHIVVDPRGFFDVFASATRPPEERPAYRGEMAELGHGVTDGARLTMRPDSARMSAVVSTWSALHGADAVGGKLGQGRQGAAPLSAADQQAADKKAVEKKTEKAEQVAAQQKTKKKG